MTYRYQIKFFSGLIDRQRMMLSRVNLHLLIKYSPILLHAAMPNLVLHCLEKIWKKKHNRACKTIFTNSSQSQTDIQCIKRPRHFHVNDNYNFCHVLYINATAVLQWYIFSYDTELDIHNPIHLIYTVTPFFAKMESVHFV